MKINLLNEATRLKKFITTEGYKELQKGNTIPSSFFTLKNSNVSFIIALYDFKDEGAIVVDDNCFFPIEGHYETFRIETKIDGVKVSQNIIGSIDNEDAVLYSDVILEQSNYFFSRHEIVPILVTLTPDSLSGFYSGDIYIYSRNSFEEEKLVFSQAIKLEVSEVCLPEKDNTKFDLDLWMHNCNIARKHEVRNYSDEHFEIIDRYIKTLSELGQKNAILVLSEIPWNSQSSYNNREYLSDMFEYNMLKVFKGTNGSLRIDTTAVDKYLEICKKYKTDKLIEIYGLLDVWGDDTIGYGKVDSQLNDYIRVRVYDENVNRFYFIKDQKEIEEYISLIYKYFVQKGIIDRVRLLVDEPKDFERFNEKLQIIKQKHPKFKYKIAALNINFIEKVPDCVTDVCIYIMTFFDHLEKVKEIIKNRTNINYTYYVCCYPNYPNTFIKNPLTEARLIPLFSEFLGVKGFLRWNYTVWPKDPRNKLSFRPTVWGTGDTNFVYPSNGGHPLLSQRYINLKRGVEDYELFMMCDDFTKKTVLDMLIKNKDLTEYYHKYIPDLYENGGKFYSIEYEVYEKARKLMCESLHV